MLNRSAHLHTISHVPGTSKASEHYVLWLYYWLRHIAKDLTFLHKLYGSRSFIHMFHHSSMYLLYVTIFELSSFQSDLLAQKHNTTKPRA